jgi:hypothetical protein
MQITFKAHKPINLTGSFVYERKTKQTKQDEIDEVFIEFAGLVSSYLSNDYFNIELNFNNGLNGFNSEFYNTKKSIKLILTCKEISGNNEKTINLDLYFDTTDSNLINEKIKEFHKNEICKKAFELLDTLVLS